MKKSLLAAMAAAALLATTAYAANTPQTNMLELKQGASAVVGGGGSGGMTAKYAPAIAFKMSTDLSAKATNFAAAGKELGLLTFVANFKAEKTSPYSVGLGFENGVPLEKVLVSTDNAVLLGKKSEVIVNAPAPNMLTNDVAVTIDPPKNGSSDTVVGTGAQFTLTAASRSPAQSRST